MNLAPADIKKEGPLYDLPIALGFILATKQLRAEIGNRLFIGELSLNGAIRPVNGVLPIAIMAKEKNVTEIIVPEKNAKEAAIVEGLAVIPASNLKELIFHLTGEKKIDPEPPQDLSKVFEPQK